MTRAKLYHFEHAEFIRAGRDWWLDMDQGLLVKLDVLRKLWGKPIHLSKNGKAIGRLGGRGDLSQHNLNKWGAVRAVDCYPDGLETEDDVRRFLSLARHVGFTGYGAYHGIPRGIMVHLDVRHDRQPDDPATWGGLVAPDEAGAWRTRYVSLDDVLKELP